MLKNVLFQLHWFLGITAGTVLAIMGITGATLAFQDEILLSMNPSLEQVVHRHEAGEHALPLTEIVARTGEGETGALQRLRVDATGVRVSMARYEGGRKHWRYFDPYTGQRLAELKGEPFFAFVENLHRRLAAGDTGRAVTGACAVTLVFFCLSGLYMRWPRRWWSLRTWFAVAWRRDGRSFLWSLHSVVGTWVMAVYLMIALTGLWWSYGWYRTAVTSLLGGTPERAAGAPKQRFGTLDLARLQAGLSQAVPGLDSGYLDLRLPGKPGQSASARVQVGEGPHDRAYDSLALDPATGAVLSQERYADMPAGRKMLASVFALHSGSFFGLPGRVVVMVSAGGMSLFFVTGWMLYLDRRRKKREARASRLQLSPVAHPDLADGRPWLIAFASQSGFAEQLAWRTAGQLQAAGLPVQVHPVARVDSGMLADARHALFVLSTFGEGEAPDAARAFERKTLTRASHLPDLAYAVLALGDRQYAQFCGFARRVETWLANIGATALFPTVDVDRADPQALATWQHHLASVTGRPISAPRVETPAMQDWVLGGRTRLNPGSAAGEVWKVSLLPPAGAHWRAGDILEVHPGHGPAPLQAPSLPVAHAQPMLLDDPAHPPAHEPPPIREYSIASIAADGTVELVVRLTTAPDGGHGLGSGWLCVHAPAGQPIKARVRHNDNFHRHVPAAPMILIGNGTGIAGLRSLLREAKAEGSHGHWLIYGERTRRHDHLFADELDAWQAEGHLARIDLAFSRDQAERVYVQHKLLAASDELIAWMARGATLYVCGSVVGMASGVDAALRGILGEDAVDDLVAEGRYRRDVY
ncbi:sulfite reductase flavoprotein subunit alpha [Luteibacter sp. ME-Dv--P-043b]|uniref:sulfite reductase flavoprotein subunit alpha n=1 Tax=Luteibacter sp. ME-Dv--P-043b TaxID=3040291 RepID=UPI0025533DB5|nr:sulfite reductase flavoprotein subunit alpha [Luteibacter sp. ME-Dv--P-043b]